MSEKSIFNRLGLAMFIYIVLWVGIQLILAAIISAVQPHILSIEWVYWVVSMAPMYAVALPVAVLLLRKLPKRQLYQHNIKGGHFLQLYFMAIGLMLIGNIIGIILTTILTNKTGLNFSVSSTDLIFEHSLGWLFLITVVLAPLVEEFLFRKVLIDRLIVFGDGAAIFISALMFGCVHGNISQLFYAFLIGLVFGFVYVRTGKIKNSIALHMAFNFCGGFVPAIFMRVVDFENLESSLLNGDLRVMLEHLGALLGFGIFELAFFGCGIAGFILLIVHRKKFVLNQGELQLSKGEVVRCLFTTPGTILFFVAIVCLFVLNVLGV